MTNEKKFTHSINSKKGIITFWSIVLIVVLFFFLKNAGLLTSVFLTTFLTWPLIVFIIAVVSLIYKQWVFGIVCMATSTFFWTPILLKTAPELFPAIEAEGFVQHYWYLLVAFIVVVIILQLIFGKENPCEKEGRWKKFGSNFQESKEGYLKSSVAFSSNEKIYLNENFKGGKFETLFGSQEIDLRKCTIPTNEKANIDLSVLFGACVIWVPAEWVVQVNTKSIFSSTEDKRASNANTGEDMLIINGECMFSSLEIRS
ncbi:MAG: cell wall-active antibiotics response protein [Lentimicrobiaceae bacterium]|nr:cell wall-active antibiotics response protein [Lentimicrobiaceae bacterium]